MIRIYTVLACVALLLSLPASDAATPVRKPLVTTPSTMRLAPGKAVCTDDHGNSAVAGEYPWTSRTSDGVVHDCTPFGCNMGTGICRTTTASTNDCRPGWSWLAPSHGMPAICSRCGADASWDDAKQTCVQQSHLGN